MNKKKLVNLLFFSSVLISVAFLQCACGRANNEDSGSNSVELDSPYEEDNDVTYDDSSNLRDSDSDSYNSSSVPSNNYDSYSSYDYSDNTDTYNYSEDDYVDGHPYDVNDPFYSANDHNGDGKLTDEEWQDAMNDAITYYYYKMQEEQ